MKDEDLDRMIEQARTRSGDVRSSQHADALWHKIGVERGRQKARRGLIRNSAGILAVTMIAVVGITFVKRGPGDHREQRPGLPLTGNHTGAVAAVNLLPSHAEAKFTLRTAVSSAQLGRVEVAALLADEAGNVYAADRRTRWVVAFDKSGNHAFNIGRQGTAATGSVQSFASIDAMAWLQDTIVVTDNSSGELVFLSRRGDVLERHPLPQEVRSVDALYSAGARLYGVGIGKSPTGDVLYFRVSSGGSYQQLPQFNRAVTRAVRVSCVAASRASYTVRAPLAPSAQLAGFTSEGDLVVSDADSVSFSIHDSRTGEISEQIATPFERIALTSERWTEENREIVELEKRVGRVHCTPQVKRPASEPAVVSVVADEKNRFWVEAMGTSGRQLLIFDFVRAKLDAVTMPARDMSVIPSVRGDHLYMITHDSTGKPQISSYARQN